MKKKRKTENDEIKVELIKIKKLQIEMKFSLSWDLQWDNKISSIFNYNY